jgi:c(7)-type cytochrome triheme protein
MKRPSSLILSAVLLMVLAVACIKPLPSESNLHGSKVALAPLPRSKYGHVDWIAAIRQGVIHPKDSIQPGAEAVKPLKLDIVFRINRALTFPDVLFPHEQHTMWLDCKNCHPSPFLMRQGANPISMDQIVKGEFCGRCHGIVAFPIQDCFRCHSRKQEPKPAKTSLSKNP